MFIFEDLGIIFGDTTRSKAYINSLVKHQFFPACAAFLENKNKVAISGQFGYGAQKIREVPRIKNTNSELIDDWSEADFDPGKSIKLTLEQHKIPYESFDTIDCNDEKIIDWVKNSKARNFIFSGYGGNILRQKILSKGKNFIHIHGGYLPTFKGSTCNYYSILMDNSFGSSAIFLNEKIDSGPILYRKKFSKIPDKLLIDDRFDSAARAKVLILLLKRYRRTGIWSGEIEEKNLGGRTYYVIHPVLKHLAILKQQ